MTQSPPRNLGPDHSSPITALCVSKNAINVATATNGIVSLWDLRKQEQAVQTLQLHEPVRRLRFDEVGQYLAVGLGNGDVEVGGSSS